MKGWSKPHSRSETAAGLISTMPQQGQALVEALVVALALVVLWVAVAWLAHYQDAALSATHASRFAAFTATRLDEEDEVAAATMPLFTGSPYRWNDRKGQSVIDFESSMRVHPRRLAALSAHAQPGQGSAQASILRRDWEVADPGILQAEIHLSFPKRDTATSPTDSGRLGLNVFDRAYPSLVRSTAILTGAGHGSTDAGVQTRLTQSTLAWSSAYRDSLGAGRTAEAAAVGVDLAWGRPAAEFDWVFPWSGYVPEHYLLDYEIETED